VWWKKCRSSVHKTEAANCPKTAQKTGNFSYGDGPLKYKISTTQYKDNLLIPFSILEYNQRLILSAEYAGKHKTSGAWAGRERQVSVHRCA
jgi:hypothetical protein